MRAAEHRHRGQALEAGGDEQAADAAAPHVEGRADEDAQRGERDGDDRFEMSDEGGCEEPQPIGAEHHADGHEQQRGRGERPQPERRAGPEQQVERSGVVWAWRCRAGPRRWRRGCLFRAFSSRRPGQRDEQRGSHALDPEHDMRPRLQAAYASITCRGATGAAPPTT